MPRAFGREIIVSDAGELREVRSYEASRVAPGTQHGKTAKRSAPLPGSTKHVGNGAPALVRPRASCRPRTPVQVDSSGRDGAGSRDGYRGARRATITPIGVELGRQPAGVRP